jgi:hypothetical protein
MPEIGISRNCFPKGKPVDQVHTFVDRGRRRSTVDHGRTPSRRRLTEEWLEWCPRAWNLTVLEEKTGGDGGEPHRLQEGAAEGRTRPGDGGEQSAEEALGGVNVADSGASK